MNAHRIDVFNRTDDDAVIRMVAHNFHLIFFPAQNGLFDQDRMGRRNRQTVAHDLFELFAVIGNAATFTAKGKAWANDRRKTGGFKSYNCFFERTNHGRTRTFKADLVHGLAEQLTVFGLFNDVLFRTDHFNAIFFKRTIIMQGKCGIQGRLATHGRQKNVRAFLFNDLGDHGRGDWLDICRIGKVRVGHDGRRIGVDQNDAIPFFLQRLTGLSTGVVELASLTDNNRASTDDENGFNVCTFRHVFFRFSQGGRVCCTASFKSVNRLSWGVSRHRDFASSIRPTKRLNR